MEIKKADKVNLEKRRWEMFLIALVIIISVGYGALSWDFSVSDKSDADRIDDVIDDIDFDKLKKNNDMVAAISQTEDYVETTNIKPADAMVKQPQEQTVMKVAQEAEPEVKEANVEEVHDPVMEQKDDMPEGAHAVEELPEFPGGAGAFMKWITARVKYPHNAMTRKIKGRVVVSFLVNESGKVRELKIENFSNSMLADAVMREMKNMPQWKPGKRNGKPCTTMVAVPINFDL